MEKQDHSESRERKQALLREFEQKEQVMNKSLNYFLVSKYGHSGEPPMKVRDPHDLIP